VEYQTGSIYELLEFFHNSSSIWGCCAAGSPSQEISRDPVLGKGAGTDAAGKERQGTFPIGAWPLNHKPRRVIPALFTKVLILNSINLDYAKLSDEKMSTKIDFQNRSSK
jgi:hypothetical protein